MSTALATEFLQKLPSACALCGALGHKANACPWWHENPPRVHRLPSSLDPALQVTPETAQAMRDYSEPKLDWSDCS